jgi:hypothetical protein
MMSGPEPTILSIFSVQFGSFQRGRFEMSVEFVAYKGYELAMTCDPPMWQVSIVPMSPNLPTRSRFLPIILSPGWDEALQDGRRAVDELLAQSAS